MQKPYSIVAVVSVVVILILLGASYWYQQSKKSEVNVTTETTSEVVAPAVSTNPLENKSDINPIDQTNPFKNVKTNPFE